MFNLSDNTYRLLVFILLLIIFGIVSFNAYVFISGKNSIMLGSGVGMQFPKVERYEYD